MAQTPEKVYTDGNKGREVANMGDKSPKDKEKKKKKAEKKPVAPVTSSAGQGKKG